MNGISNAWNTTIDESLILGPLLLFRTSLNHITKFVPSVVTLRFSIRLVMIRQQLRDLFGGAASLLLGSTLRFRIIYTIHPE